MTTNQPIASEIETNRFKPRAGSTIELNSPALTNRNSFGETPGGFNHYAGAGSTPGFSPRAQNFDEEARTGRGLI